MKLSKAETDILNIVPNGIIVAGQNGKLIFVNLASERILGKGITEAPPAEWSKYFGCFLPDQTTYFPEAELPLVRALRGESSSNVEMFICNEMLPDGAWIVVSGQPIIIDGAELIGGIVVFQDITARKLLEIDKQRLADIVQSSDDAIFRRNLEGIVQSWNKSAERIFGYKADEIIGKSGALLFPPDKMNEEAELIAGLMRGEHVNHFETVRLAKDGTRIDVSLTISPITDAGGSIIATSKIIRDIRGQREAEKEIRNLNEQLQTSVQELRLANEELTQLSKMEMEARKQAQDASKFKSEFVANMSHEIRTPMNGIIGMCNVLLDTDLDSRQREFANAIKDSGKALLTVINDILDFSKIEAGKITIESHEFDPVQLVEGTCLLLASEARAKELSLNCYVDPAIPRLMLGDRDRLRQVLLNLLSNAIKFSENGSISVEAELESSNNNSACIKFTVADKGIGLSPDETRKLFRPFVQADGSITRRYGGTGLGLSISKSLVELMGGQIGVESVKGQGSKFWFELSLRRGTDKQDSAPAKSLSVPAAHNALKNLSVLIIDDDDEAIEILQAYLSSWGMKSSTAGSAKDALKALRQAYVSAESFDFAIVDMVLPDRSGLDLAEEIFKDPAISRSKLFLLTAFDFPELGERALEIGFKAYLTKPIAQSRLLNSFVETVQAEEMLQEEPNHKEDRQTENAESDRKQSVILVAEDHPINQQVAKLYLERFDLRCHIVSNGKEAVEAASKNDYSLLLMDCQMPEMDGFEATHAIRKAEALKGTRIPIIAMTAHAMKGDKERCLSEGMDDYLSKPVNPDELKTLIDKWIPMKRNEVVSKE